MLAFQSVMDCGRCIDAFSTSYLKVSNAEEAAMQEREPTDLNRC